MARKLYRSTEDKKIAGVCGGLGDYFDIDPTIIRLLWVSMVLALGTGIVAYILAWIIVPVMAEKTVQAAEPVVENS